MSNKKSLLMEDLRILLDDLSLASKWNSDILEQLLSHKSGDSDNESTGDSSTPLDFIPDENPGNYIDVSRDSIKAVCLSYLKLMEVDLEAKRKGKVFEEFTRQFFRLIKGWKVIDENANLGDCEIDLIYDITAGPPLLRQRLGDNLYVECKNRSDKSDSRDISQFVLNLMSRKVKSGIFFSMAGITGYQPENWRANTAGYKRIVDACRIHGVIVLPVVREDIELVRNGRNLVTYLEELVNRFVRI